MKKYLILGIALGLIFALNTWAASTTFTGKVTAINQDTTNSNIGSFSIIKNLNWWQRLTGAIFSKPIKSPITFQVTEDTKFYLRTSRTTGFTKGSFADLKVNDQVVVTGESPNTTTSNTYNALEVKITGRFIPVPKPIPPEPGTIIDVNVGEQFSINLEENASTGYKWYYNIANPSIVSFVKQYYQAKSGSIVPGAPSEHFWVFKGFKAGTTTITFTSRRGFSSEGVKTVVYTINVKGAEPTPIGNCGWCGRACVRKTPSMYCPQVMPPVGVSCQEINGVCQITTITPTTIENCAKEGEMFSSVYSQYPKHCCPGLTEWMSGMDSRIVKNGQCVETGLLKGSPIGTCIKCGDGICGLNENICNCPQDCTSPAPTCTDSDGGKNYYVKGTVTYNGQTYIDGCTCNCPWPGECRPEDCKAVVEYYCENGVMKQETQVCPTGYSCQDGACKPTSTASITVLSPNGGERWQIGKTYSIEWKISGFDKSSILVIYSDFGIKPLSFSTKVIGDLIKTAREHATPSDLNKLISGLPGIKIIQWGTLSSLDQKYSWTIPSSYITGKYKIGIVALDLNNWNFAWDESDNSFSIVTATTTCTDSDEGRDYTVKGTVTYNGQTYTDFCDSDSSTVFEYYCFNGAIGRDPHICESGYTCRDGACKHIAEDLPTGTLSITPSEVNLGEPFKITVTGQDDQGVKSVGLWYQGLWHSQNCNNQTTCTKIFTVTETKAGTYEYSSFIEGTTTSGGSQYAYTNPKTVTGIVKSTTPLSVTVLIPQQDEILQGNSASYYIQWAHTGSDSKFNHYRIGYKCDGDSSVIAITTTTSINDSIFVWQTPNISSNKTNCQVEVRAEDINNNILGSPGFSGKFTIVPISTKKQETCIDVTNNGNPLEKLNIVFVGANYSESEKNKFISDVNAHTQKLLSVYPFSAYKNRINIYRVDTLNLNCDIRNAALICDFGNGQDLGQKLKELASVCPWNQIILLANANIRGGPIGFSISITASANPSMTLHEFGHAFGGLWDEYVLYGDDPDVVNDFARSPNCDSNPNCPKWNNIAGAGCFKGCGYYTNAYRSIDSGIMRDLGATSYGPVNEKHLIELLNHFR